ncbi:MAG: enoyl-CoA hydratase [Defluviicoccus sp.]|nr:enoyl-CoA hydratase [Defluviicoccus sp.]MDE0383363.1 enoyl-CoA hydratase [Defluviicoccus sp.]
MAATLSHDAASNDAPVLRRDADGIATLVLNRPAARNALSSAAMAALQAEIDSIAAEPSVRVLVIGANGPAFCAGHDMRELRANPSKEAVAALFGESGKLMLSLIRLPKPVIARVQGTATAAGCQLVASCDLAVASSDAKFATPGVEIGLFCSTPMVAISRNVPRKRMMEMLLTGDAIDAETAAEYGLVNRVVAPEALEAETNALAARIAQKSALTVAIGKQAFYRQVEAGFEDAYRVASEAMTRNMLARDAGEGIDAFLEKREPRWEDR